MKKIIITLLFPFLIFSQDLDFNKAYSISAGTFELDPGEYADDMFGTVPSGEIWYVDFISNQTPGDISIESKNQDGNFTLYYASDVSDGFFGQGEQVELFPDDTNSQVRFFIYKFKLNSQAVLASAPSEIIENGFNRPTLYPNPTSSLLALNSDKEYDIEVYDMAGNKVMALTGNTIDMSHLSSATYIVKALDKVKNEEVSYKVVKN